MEECEQASIAPRTKTRLCQEQYTYSHHHLPCLHIVLERAARTRWKKVPQIVRWTPCFRPPEKVFKAQNASSTLHQQMDVFLFSLLSAPVVCLVACELQTYFWDTSTADVFPRYDRKYVCYSQAVCRLRVKYKFGIRCLLFNQWIQRSSDTAGNLKKKQAVVHARLSHKRRVWGGGNTSPLKTAAWEARKITDKEISGKSHLARNRRQDP